MVIPEKGFAYARPLHTSNNLIILGNLDGHLYAVSATTGEYKWRFASEGAKQGLGVTSSV